MNLLNEWLPIILALLMTGIVAGVLAGLLGVGGGIVIVPVLFLIFQSLGISPAVAMPIATATSLMTIVPTSLSSTRSHHKRANVDWDLVRRWAIPLLAGVLIASVIATRINGLVLTLVFGTIAILVALNMLLRAHVPPLGNTLPSIPAQFGLAAMVGFFSVLMGIGGGTLGVPSMTSFNVPAHRAVGTAAFFGLLIALPSSLIMLLSASTPQSAPPGTYGLVNVPGFLVILPMTTLMAPVGVKLGSNLDGTTLKRIFAAFLIVVGLRMLWQTLSSL